MRTYTQTLTVDTPREQVWKAAGERFGDVAAWAPGLDASRMANGATPEVGQRRACEPSESLVGMDAIEEEITAWDPPRSFSYRVFDPPFPLAWMEAMWMFEALGKRTEVAVRVEVGIHGGRVLDPLAALVWHTSLKPLMRDSLEAFQTHVEAGSKVIA